MRIAVVGFQGSVEEHLHALQRAFEETQILGEAIWARRGEDLTDVQGIIIPGGESTVIGKFLHQTGVGERIQELICYGVHILSTCAGTILLSKGHLQLLDITVQRNGYGRQKDSFEAVVDTSAGKTKGIFIRAPVIASIFGNAKAFATSSGKVVGVEQGNILAFTFHPELADDGMLHGHFIRKIKEAENHAK